MLKPECREFVEALLNQDLGKAKSLGVSVDINAPCMEGGWTALHLMAEHNVLGSARFLLENGANPNQTDDAGWTPLHLSLDSEVDSITQSEPLGDVPLLAFEMATLLLSYGADPNASTKKGETPLDLITRYPKAVELLKQYGAKGSR